MIVSILAAIVCVGCKRPADLRMEEFSKNVRQTINPAELESWATKVISNTPREQFFVELTTNGVPEGIRRLMTNFETLEVGTDGLSNDKVVVFTRGSGFGHWGFAVGAPTYTCSFGHVQSHWTNGIWFWTE